MSILPGHLLETSLRVQDVERSRDFYNRVFGLKTLLEDEQMIGLELPGSAVLLLLQDEDADRQGAMPGLGANVPQHLCIYVPPTSFSDWDRHLSLLGLVIESRVRQRHGGISLYFRDPDGHSVEVATPAP